MAIITTSVVVSDTATETVFEDTFTDNVLNKVVAKGLRTVAKAGSPAANEESIRAKAQAAIQTNITALALPDPTPNNTAYLNSPALVAGASAAQVQAYVRLMDAQLRALTSQNNSLIAQLRAVTRQNTALIRELVRAFDSTDGT
jgi:hypothetical protein